MAELKPIEIKLIDVKPEIVAQIFIEALQNNTCGIRGVIAAIIDHRHDAPHLSIDREP